MCNPSRNEGSSCFSEMKDALMNVDRRFRSLANLYGESNTERLMSSHIVVIGLGGVGSWIVEALARSAVGHLTIVDLDNISISNTNRQIHALKGEYGKPKTQALSERIQLINPNIHVRMIEDFITEDNIEELIFCKKQEIIEPLVHYDMVIDAIDNARTKASLIASCLQNSQPILTIGGAGGKVDPTKIDYDDLSNVKNDPLLSAVRSRLRRIYDFPKGTVRKKDRYFNVLSVYSNEHSSIRLHTPSLHQGKQKSGLNCMGLGSSICVTAAMGFSAAAYALNKITGYI